MADNTEAIIITIRRCLAKGTDRPNAIQKALHAQDIELSLRQIDRYVVGIYQGKHPDPWLDKFLNVTYPEQFKKSLQGLETALELLLKYARDGNAKERTLAASNYGKLHIEYMNLIHKGPAISMMRKLKVKAERLAKEVTEERKITKKLPIS